MKRLVTAVLIFLFFLPFHANALLLNNFDGTVTQFKEDGSSLMWMQDASYSLTSGSDDDGWMTWYEANDWIEHLNSNSAMGYSDWRLPNNLPVNPPDHLFLFSYDGSTDFGFNITRPQNDLAYLFYEELGNFGQYDVDGNERDIWGLTNSDPFENIEDDLNNL